MGCTSPFYRQRVEPQITPGKWQGHNPSYTWPRASGGLGLPSGPEALDKLPGSQSRAELGPCGREVPPSSLGLDLLWAQDLESTLCPRDSQGQATVGRTASGGRPA